MPGLAGFNPELLVSDEEKKLVNRLSLFPQEVKRAALDRAPHVIVSFAYDLAADFHSFYNANRILGERQDIMDMRLLLVQASKSVLSRSLKLWSKCSGKDKSMPRLRWVLNGCPVSYYSHYGNSLSWNFATYAAQFSGHPNNYCGKAGRSRNAVKRSNFIKLREGMAHLARPV